VRRHQMCKSIDAARPSVRPSVRPCTVPASRCRSLDRRLTRRRLAWSGRSYGAGRVVVVTRGTGARLAKLFNSPRRLVAGPRASPTPDVSPLPVPGARSTRPRSLRKAHSPRPDAAAVAAVSGTIRHLQTPARHVAGNSFCDGTAWHTAAVLTGEGAGGHASLPVSGLPPFPHCPNEISGECSWTFWMKI